jgi:hypothetical protein
LVHSSKLERKFSADIPLPFFGTHSSLDVDAAYVSRYILKNLQNNFLFFFYIPQRVFENRVSRRIFGPKRDYVTRGWRKLHNEELNDLYSSIQYFSGDKIEKNEMGGACSAYWGEEKLIQCFGGET